MVSRLRAWLSHENVSKDLLLLLLIGGLYSLGIFLSSTFVNIYLWKQSNSYTDIALYNLSIYVLQPLTFIFAGKCAKHIDRVIVLRTGVIVLSLFFLTVLIVGENAAKFNIMLGALLGVGYGFYWLAYNVLTFEITEPDTRDFFNGFLGVLQSLGGMTGPLLAGFIISRLNNFTGYTVIFAVSFGLFIVAVLVSFGLSRRKAKGNFSFRRIINERKNNLNWKRILNAHVSQGFREGTFLFAVSIWIFLMTRNELSLGFFNLVYSGFSFLFYFLVTRLVKPRRRKKAIFIAGLSLYLSVLILLVSKSMALLLLYGAIAGIFFPLLYVPYISLTYDVIGKSWNAGEMRIEYIVVRELFLNLGRVLSIIVFLLAIVFIAPETGIPYILLLVGGGHFLIYFFIKDIDTKVVPSSHN
ncbi:MFS transporter [Halobacillus halophilus]|uniref:MFS-type transporter n=1 Tax=Halobacillus halophilus (strain ATCC 35676 / DSM 2266 / JCM 20832 / KCTC 3685 / LMG 17431 / NBRC 102448 / NCIMB 2269) TaxID=866895 RepID=I0JP10_HALH3|nr:MFS transporter [Halobacillus halophilus]ASF39923.1 MFS transporter [Halobacillus halophilus]CCG45880.1 putative MFS-type transporter [Halobacillus halophilus DSM 2266]